MHEYSIIQALVTRVEQEARQRGATQVHKLKVSLGEQSGVDPQLLATAYDTFRAGTICQSAPMELTTIPVEWRCKECKAVLPSGGPLRCKKCRQPAYLARGEEILLEQIEMEVP